MKKILYVITSPAHKRVLESFVERSDMEQLIVGPPPGTGKFIPEDYRDFKIKNIKTININFDEIKKITKSFLPDIYVQPDLSPVHKKVYNDLMSSYGKKPYKRVYISHGMIGNHVKDLMSVEKFDQSVWSGLDLYCGATKIFADWVKYVAGAQDEKILLNALPQLDILYNREYYNSYRDIILNKVKAKNVEKVILFLGFCCKDRHDYKAHNADYFKTAIELGKIAKENNILVLIKPRQTEIEMVKFLNANAWGKDLIKPYLELKNNNNVHFIGPASTHIYRYYFADAFVLNGCSTAEIEACAINKPLFIVRTNDKCLKSGYDPYNTVNFGAAHQITDIGNLKEDLLANLYGGKFYFPDKQNEIIKNISVSFDGNMHKRIQNKLLEL